MIARLFTAALGAVLLAPHANAFTRPPVSSAKDMVVTSQTEASKIGAAILRGGGNAIDAAVAIGYALAVSNPCCGNIGGGVFATIRLADGRETFINFREKAPAAASEKMYLDAKGGVVPDLSLNGYLAVAVPGTVKGLDAMLQKYGTLPREKVMAPAIRLAAEGFALSAETPIFWRRRPRNSRARPISPRSS